MMKVYAVTLTDGTTQYNLSYEDAVSIYEPGCRLWESVNGGISYFEIFLS